jgi:hypothetical protein
MSKKKQPKPQVPAPIEDWSDELPTHDTIPTLEKIIERERKEMEDEK